MAYYAVAPVQSELKTTLYSKEVYAGSDTNGVSIINRSEPMGATWVFSWPVTDGPGPDANIVGHMQGTGVQVANTPNLVWHYSLGLVFGDQRFNGSTLQISGTSQINGEWSIVGGTGELTLAKGTVKRTQISYSGHTRISELKIHAFYTSMNRTSLKAYKTQAWGSGSHGTPFDVKAAPVRMVDRITVRYGNIVDAIEFSYIDKDGNKHRQTVGGPGGNSKTITLAPSEYVIEVSGSIGTWAMKGGQPCISSIKFVTNKGSYGPFGNAPNATGSYSARADDGHNIAGFYGRSGDCVNALGFYMHPV